MNFQMKITLISFILTVVLGFIITPLLKRLKIGQIVRDDGPKTHLKKQGTPTMGAIIFIISSLLVSIAGFIYYTNAGEPDIGKGILILLFSTIGFGIVGFVDDFKKLILKNPKGLKPLHKMIGLFCIATVFVIYVSKFSGIGTETFIPFIKQYIALPIFIYIPFTVLVMLATTNAINLTDGIDGLATIVSIIILLALTVIGTVLGIKEIIIFGSILIAACSGFLVFNLNPAKVFMGDTGSLALGGAISSMAIYLKMPLLIIIIAIVPLIETLSVIIQVAYFKKSGGKRVFKMTPLHHHYELSGWKENKILVVFGLVTIVACMFGVSLI